MERSKGNSSNREGQAAGEGVKRQSSVMSAGCCGTKKQKTTNSSSSSCNGTDDGNGSSSSSNTHFAQGTSSSAGLHHHSHLTNGHARNGTVAHPEMGFYCFDVLYSHLHSSEPPKPPRFTNEE